MGILGFTKREVELVLMSVQCIRPNRRFKIGWEVSYKLRPQIWRSTAEFLRPLLYRRWK